MERKQDKTLWEKYNHNYIKMDIEETLKDTKMLTVVVSEQPAYDS